LGLSWVWLEFGFSLSWVWFRFVFSLDLVWVGFAGFALDLGGFGFSLSCVFYWVYVEFCAWYELGLGQWCKSFVKSKRFTPLTQTQLIPSTKLNINPVKNTT
jgi:hypothetical protein